MTDPQLAAGAATACDAEERPGLPHTHATRRGVIALLEANCTVCMICARECPDWCIDIASHKETVTPEGGGRDRVVAVLDRFAIDYGLCMYCGICVEACPFDALFWGSADSYPEAAAGDLVHDQARLGSWLPSVPTADLPDGAADPAADKRPDGGGTSTPRP